MKPQTTLKVSNPKDVILDYLMCKSSADNPIKSRELEMITGLSPRQVGILIAELRIEHAILATNTAPYGFWIAANPQEIKGYVAFLKSRLRAYEATIKVMEGHIMDEVF